MKKRILFLGPFPNDNNRKEGMVQRIDAIDHIISNPYLEKIYLTISFKTLRNSKKVKKGNIVNYSLSFWTSYFKIIRNSIIIRKKCSKRKK